MKEISWGFAGCKEQGLEVLKALVAKDFVPNFVAVLDEIPDTEKQTFRDIANSIGVPFIVTKNFEDNPSPLSEIDLLFTCRFNLLKAPIFSTPKLGTINLHQSLLPKYRGVHPISWALIHGEASTGVTIHKTDSGIDRGDILKQVEVAIEPDDDFCTLTTKLNRAGAVLATELFAEIRSTGALPRATPQPSGEFFYARRRSPSDGRMDWNERSSRLAGLLRALPEPLPSAYCESPTGEKIEIRTGKSSARPGEILAKISDSTYVVRTVDGCVLIECERALNVGDRLK